MNDPVRVQVIDSAHDRLDEFGGILFLEVLECTDTIKEFSSLTQISHEVHCRTRFARISSVERTRVAGEEREDGVRLFCV